MQVNLGSRAAMGKAAFAGMTRFPFKFPLRNEAAQLHGGPT
jgi:hypothetical protein